jgi:hypothetical protein
MSADRQAAPVARTYAGSAEADDPHPALRGQVRRALYAGENPRVPASLRRRGGGRGRHHSRALEGAGPDRRDLPRARPRAGARRADDRRSWPKCTASRKAAAAAAAAPCICSIAPRTSTAATPSSAAACRSQSGWRWPTRCRDNVTACFFGEGAVAEGEFHESLNLAALVGPSGAVCLREQSLCDGHCACDRASRNRHPAQGRLLPDRSEAVDGMDVVAVEAAARRAIHAVRESGKPYFLECLTYRLRAHSMFDAQLYRDKSEVDAWRKKEPIVRFQGWLEANHMIHRRTLPASKQRSTPRSTRRSHLPKRERGSRSST